MHKLLDNESHCAYNSKYLFIILTIFTCTFFIYKDFDIRMILGFGLMGVILGIYLINCLRKKQKLQFSPIEIAFSFFMIVLLLSFCRPDSRHDSDSTSYMIALVIFGAYLLVNRPSEKEIRIGFYIFTGVAVIFSLILLLFKLYPELYWTYAAPALSEVTQKMAMDSLPYGYGIPIGGNYFFTNCILAMGLSCILGYLLSYNFKPIKTILSLFSAYLLFVGSALTGVRGDFLAFTLTFAFVYIFTACTRRLKIKAYVKKVAVFLAVCIVAASILILLNANGLIPRYASTIEKVSQGFATVIHNDDHNENSQPNEDITTLPDFESAVDEITSGRTYLWKLALELFRGRPLFGTGWGSFANHITDEWRAVHGEQVSNVHNFVLQFLCETGLVGTILLLFPIGYIYLHTISQTIRLKKRSGTDKKYLLHMNLTSLGIQTFFCIGGMFSSTIFQYVFWGCYGIAVIIESSALRMEGYAFNDKFTMLMRRICSKILSLQKRRDQSK